MANKQKSSRKHGRNRNRPSNKLYTLAKRWIANKQKAIKRNARLEAMAKLKKLLRLPESSRDNEQVMELRQIISQNRTGT